MATISYWQSGRSRPERATSLAALAVLEELLALEPGELAGKLPARRRSGPTLSATHGRDGRVNTMPELSAAAALVGLSWDMGLMRVAVHDRIEVGQERNGASHGVKELLVAEREGVDRYPLLYKRSGEGDGAIVAPVRNCSVGRIAEVPEVGLMVAEIILDHPLREGESILVEHELNLYGTSRMEPSVERLFVRTVRSAHTEVLFHESCLPLSAERYTVVGGVQKAEPVVIAGRALHALVLDFGPGSYGLRWTW